MPDSTPLRWIPRSLGALAGLIGLAVLVGWWTGLPGPERLHPTLRSMAPNAALAVVLAAGSVLLRAADRGRGLAIALAATVALIGGATWLQTLIGVDLGIDALVHAAPPGSTRMAGPTALNVLLTGLVLLLAHVRRRRAAWVAVVLGLLLTSSAVEGIAGLLFRITYLPSTPFPVAVHALIAFSALGIASLAVGPRDGPLAVLLDEADSSIFVRRLLPIAVGGRILLGWLTLSQGKAPGPEAAVAGVATIGTANLLMVTALVFWSARSLAHAQRERDRVQRDLARAEDAAQNRAAVAEALRRAATAQEDERRRIARELHDGVGASMAQLLLTLDTHIERLPAGAERDGIREVRRALTEVIGELGRTARGLHPSLLEDLGLAAAVTEHARAWSGSTGIKLDLAFSLGNHRLPPAVELAALRIVQEALSNVARHAEAGTVSLVMTVTKDTLLVMVEDNGRGFDPDAPRDPHRLGLRDIGERVLALGGDLKIESQPGEGTTVRARIPLEPA